MLLLSGCGGGEPSAPTLTREQFIEVIVDLRTADIGALETDSAGEVFAREKEAILERHQTSDEEIRAFVESPRSVSEMAGIWEEISQRLRRPLPGATPDSLGGA